MITKMDVRRGTEGPRHDPYGYEELVVSHKREMNQKEQEIVLHSGLAEWIEVDGVKHVLYDGACETIFEDLVGIDPVLLMRIVENRQYRCKRCNTDKYMEWVSGYPGESLLICRKCGQIAHSEVNMEAI